MKILLLSLALLTGFSANAEKSKIDKEHGVMSSEFKCYKLAEISGIDTAAEHFSKGKISHILLWNLSGYKMQGKTQQEDINFWFGYYSGYIVGVVNITMKKPTAAVKKDAGELYVSLCTDQKPNPLTKKNNLLKKKLSNLFD